MTSDANITFISISEVQNTMWNDAYYENATVYKSICIALFIIWLDLTTPLKLVCLRRNYVMIVSKMQVSCEINRLINKINFNK